jgi:hypothetical protein
LGGPRTPLPGGAFADAAGGVIVLRNLPLMNVDAQLILKAAFDHYESCRNVGPGVARAVAIIETKSRIAAQKLFANLHPSLRGHALLEWVRPLDDRRDEIPLIVERALEEEGFSTPDQASLATFIESCIVFPFSGNIAGLRTAVSWCVRQSTLDFDRYLDER